MNASSLVLATLFSLSSPDGDSRAVLTAGNGVETGALGNAPALTYRIEAGGRAITRDAQMGITLDGVSFGAGPGAEMLAVHSAQRTEAFATRGNHRSTKIIFNELTLDMRDRSSGRAWRIEARMSDNAFAWRYVVPVATVKDVEAAALVRVLGERSEFRPIADCNVWIAERPNDWKLKSYAGYWMRAPWEKLPAASKEGPVNGPPLVVELPCTKNAAAASSCATAGSCSDGKKIRWLIFTEAGLRNYSGMRLRAARETGASEQNSDVRARADFTEGAKGFEVRVENGAVTSPWRVVYFAKTLTDVVNCTDVLEALSPPADEATFVNAESWVRGGRAAWFWWSQRRAGTPAEETRMVECAAQLGFEYSLVDEGWLGWPDPWANVRELTAFARSKGVRILLWRHMKDTMNPENNYADLRAYLDQLRDAGVAGMKIDFFNAETREMVDLQQAIMREAAKRKLLVLFHGCQKPTGETRTWPNQLSREGIRGLELNGMKEGPITAEHNCALPFTRLAVGPGDYTPLGFSFTGPTTWAHQLATTAVFLSPIQVIAEYPEMLLKDKRCAIALDLIKAVPAEWDEARVLAPSEIGECVVIARRRGGEWWLSVLNAAPRKIAALDLGFLGDGAFRAIAVTSGAKATEVAPLHRAEIDRVTRDTKLPLDLTRGDGALIRFVPAK